ncbi:MAG: hypothetical protein K5855_07960 [Oscillospiraceae bacterium]|nr:hypothetical protein [Oscillospiraceae bacterium]
MLLEMSACMGPGNNDWSYAVNADYEIWHVNSNTIIFGRADSLNSISTVVESYVSAFCHNGRFAVIERSPDGKDTEKREYYLIDMDRDAVYGPYDAADLEAETKKQNVGELCDWISTSPAPKDAAYP